MSSIGWRSFCLSGQCVRANVQTKNTHRENAMTTKPLYFQCLPYPRYLFKGVALAAALAGASAAQANVPAISVNGKQILFNGKVGSIAGNSLFWSNTGWGGEKFYNASVVSYLKNTYKSQLIRVAVGVGAPAAW